MIRRSPAEYFVRYRLLESPRVEVDTLIEELEEELIFVPSNKYVEKLRRTMNIPAPFRPRSLAEKASQDLLIAQGVWTMFHPATVTREARALLQNVRPRMAVQLLLAASVPDEMIVEVEVRREWFTGDLAALDQLAQRIAHEVRDEILVTPKVKLVEPGALPKAEGRAVRVRDLRQKWG